MNLRTLQIFQCVCEEETITTAAKKLFMTQPAISHAIRELEEELQLKVFDRKGKRIFLNEKGRVFLQQTQRVLTSFDELVNSVYTIEEETKIRIGSSITIANDVLPKALTKFKEVYPNTPVEVHVERATDVMGRLRNRSIDIALVEGVVHQEEYHILPLSSYQLHIVCSKKHPLAKHSTLKWCDVSKYAWLLREKGSAVRDTFDSACLLHQIYIEPIWTSVNSQALLQAVKENLGLAILPEFIVNMYPFLDELHIVSLEDQSLRNENHIVYDKKMYISDVSKYLIQCLQEGSVKS